MIGWLLLLCIILVLSDVQCQRQHHRRMQVTRLDINASWSRLLNHKSEPKLVVFISITSGKFHAHLRQAARETWLLPCLESPVCDYRFFVDCPPSRMTDIIVEENKLFQDLVCALFSNILTPAVSMLIYNDFMIAQVFRNSCSLMNVHPDDIHYGNSPLAITASEGEPALSVYDERIFYKIDWKVCFMRWIVENHRNAPYHVFVEDDSFVCTENLIFQVKTLVAVPSEHKTPFRSGTIMVSLLG